MKSGKVSGKTSTSWLTQGGRGQTHADHVQALELKSDALATHMHGQHDAKQSAVRLKCEGLHGEGGRGGPKERVGPAG